MKKSIDYIIADPEGNITILVLSPVDRMDYQTVARTLLAKHTEAEQVGYVLDGFPSGDNGKILPYMEMCGLEFCGNATRAFSLYEAVLQDPPEKELDVKVSGCSYPLHAWIEMDPENWQDEDPNKSAGAARNVSSGTVRIEMPLPEEVEDLQISVTSDLAEHFGIPADTNGRDSFLGGRLIHLDGISHLVISSISQERITASSRDTMDCLFQHLRDSVYQLTSHDMPAFGVMLLDHKTHQMTPIVYVRDVDTTYYEGSCASGTAAAACASALGETANDGEFSYVFRQPRGTLKADIKKEDRHIMGLQLYGNVKLTETLRTEIEVGE